MGVPSYLLSAVLKVILPFLVVEIASNLVWLLKGICSLKANCFEFTKSWRIFGEVFCIWLKVFDWRLELN